jgi:hypothetical protein
MPKAEELVLLWKRADGMRCVALKHAPTKQGTKRWELRVTRLSRIIKREVFDSFRGAMHAATLWRSDFAAGS